MARQAKKKRRPRDPEATRRALIDAAAEQFNEAGYHGTDTNRIARAAGYSPATFYKHFSDKLDIFAAAYESWVVNEWTEIDAAIAAADGTDAVVANIVRFVLEHHRRWRGLRSSLRELSLSSERIRETCTAQRRAQLEVAAAVRARLGCEDVPPPEETAFLFYVFERTCDAIADGETEALELDTEALLGCMERELHRYLSWPD